MNVKNRVVSNEDLNRVQTKEDVEITVEPSVTVDGGYRAKPNKVVFVLRK